MQLTEEHGVARTTRKANLLKSAWLLAPLWLVGCASTDAKKSGDGFGAFGQSTSSEPSWSEKLAAPFKGAAGGNRTATANDNDALSLSKPPNKKNPDLIVAIAQMHERAGKLDEAESQYKKALKLQPKHLGALMGYAHLQDRRNKLDAAAKLYHTAITAHPKEAAPQNDLGLCYHRRGMLPESQAALTKAVELAPDKKLYRNNLATVLVEQGQMDAALAQLTAAHGQAAGHYNLGYLLAKKGDRSRALGQFQQAATLDPTLAAAQQWVAKLSPSTNDAGPKLAGPSIATPVPSVAQRIETVREPAPNVDIALPPEPGVGPRYLRSNPDTTGQQGSTDRWTAPPAAVRYPNQQTSGYTGTAALPPTPDQLR